MNALNEVEPTRRGVDARAVVLGGLAAAAVSFVLYLYFVPAAVGAGSAAVVLRYMASVFAGPQVLAPPATVTPAVVFLGLSSHLVVSLLMTAVIAYVLHRWGLITGIVGGAVLGFILYVIVHYTLTLAFPHFFVMSHWSVALVHTVFGAVAGGVYEIFEFEPGEEPLPEML